MAELKPCCILLTFYPAAVVTTTVDNSVSVLVIWTFRTLSGPIWTSFIRHSRTRDDEDCCRWWNFDGEITVRVCGCASFG